MLCSVCNHLPQAQEVALFNAVTEFDRKASTRKGYSPYALAHYAKGLQDIRKRVAIGATLRQAIVLTFHDRVRDALLKSVGEPLHVKWEEHSMPSFDIDDE